MRFVIDVYSHGFKVHQIQSDDVRRAVYQYSSKLIQYSLQKTQAGFSKTPKAVFAASTADRTEFRFSRNSLDDFIQHLDRCGIRAGTYALNYVPLYEPAPITAKMPESWVARELQVPIIDYVIAPGAIKTITATTGFGKALPNHTPIKVPGHGNWKPIGQLKVGDEVVSPYGTPTKVTGVYPQGIVDTYRIILGDGRFIDACGEHLWKVFYCNTTIRRRWRVVNTIEMIRLMNMAEPRVYIQLIEPEEGTDIELPIPPYTLGVILGDGGISEGAILVTKKDESLFANLEKELPSSLQINNRDEITKRIVKKPGEKVNVYAYRLKELGLWGLKSHEKFIPDIYLKGSKKQREELLRGLMDTDGTIRKDGTGGVSFSSSSKSLSEGVVELVRSLGGLASLKFRRSFYPYNGKKLEGKGDHRVHIRVKNPSKLFSIDSKRGRAKESNQYSEELKIRVKSITPYRKEECTCISVDHPDKLFVAKDYIVTHNTTMSLRACELIGKRLLIVVLGRYFDKWVGDVVTNYGLKPGQLITARGFSQLKDLLEMVAVTELKADVIITTTTSMQDYIKLYEDTRLVGFPEWLVSPERMYEVLGVGVRIVDEVHQHFHVNFKMDLYTHLPKGLYLSATLESDDTFTERMYKLAYPMNTRINSGAFHKYAEVTAIEYSLQYADKVKCSRNGSYNHIVYEEWLMKKKQALANYLEMIGNIVETDYVKKRVDKQKMLIFAASVEMCRIIAEYLKKRFPKFTIGKYTSEDKYETLMTNDISVSTIGSSGTAVDIPDLITCLMTTGVVERKANLQALGRLRDLKHYPNQKVHFLYLVCTDIRKQREYHQKKLELFKPRVLVHRTMGYGRKI